MISVDLACSLGLVSAMALVAAAYARRVARRGAAHHARIERAGGSPLLGKGLMEMGYWAIRPLARACVALRIGANAVSWSSLVLAAAGAASLALGHYGIGAALSVTSFVCDALDGMVARETGTASDAGEVLDATIDRYAELLFLGGIVLHERGDPVALVFALTAIAGAVMVSYSTAKAEALNVEAPRGAMRRQERAVYFVLGTALVPLAAAAASHWTLPPWVARLPLFVALGLVGVVGNVSAALRLRSIAAAVRKPAARHARDHRTTRPPSRAHATAGDPIR